MRLDRAEGLVRAICSDKIDMQNGRISKSLFKGVEISLSRLVIFPLPKQWPVLAATVQKLPGRRLERLGEIAVAEIEDLGAKILKDADNRPASLTAIAQPLPHNEAHAVIREEIKSDALAKALVASLRVHAPPVGFVPENVPRII